MPYPENLSFAAEVEKEIRACGAHPATMALIGGKIKVGLSPEELELMCRGENVGKVVLTVGSRINKYFNIKTREKHYKGCKGA